MSDAGETLPETPIELHASPPTPTYSTSTAGPSAPVQSLGMPSHLGFGLSIQQGGQATDAIVAKLTDEHLTQVITQADNDSSRKHVEKMMWMKLTAGITVMLMMALPFICFLFLWYGKPELLQPVIFTLVGGFGGFGLGRVYEHKSQPDKG